MRDACAGVGTARKPPSHGSLSVARQGPGGVPGGPPPPATQYSPAEAEAALGKTRGRPAVASHPAPRQVLHGGGPPRARLQAVRMWMHMSGGPTCLCSGLFSTSKPHPDARGRHKQLAT